MKERAKAWWSINRRTVMTSAVTTVTGGILTGLTLLIGIGWHWAASVNYAGQNFPATEHAVKILEKRTDSITIKVDNHESRISSLEYYKLHQDTVNHYVTNGIWDNNQDLEALRSYTLSHKRP